MTPTDFLRAVTPYNPAIGGQVGSRNTKYQFSAHKDKASEERRKQHLVEVTKALSGNHEGASASLRALKID